MILSPLHRISRTQGFILLAGISLSLFLLLQTPDGVFYSGDSGIKYLMVKQAAAGKSPLLMDIPDTMSREEILGLWETGYFPYAPPFLYPVPGGNMFGFPPLFAWITAPFFLLLGFKGLYMIPLLSLWILWYRWIILGNFLKFSPAVISWGLWALIFTTPLTLYGNMFWEHIPGVLLIFFGIEGSIYLLKKNCGTGKAITLGFLAGLSIWIRPENIVLAALLIIGAGVAGFRNRYKPALYYGCSVIGTFFLFLVSNVITFGHWMGIHGLQVAIVKSRGIGVAIRQYTQISGTLQMELIKTFPLVILFLLCVFYFLKKRETIPMFLISLCTLFYITVPVILPGDGGKQWGPRFLLAIIPVLLLTIMIFFQAPSSSHHRGKLTKLFTALCIPLAGLGFYQNAIAGTSHLLKDYRHRVFPLLETVSQREEIIVIISDPFISQDLASSFNEKFFLRIHDIKSLRRLTAYLKNQGVSRCLYITRKTINHVPPPPFSAGPSSATEFKSIGEYGNFLLYQVQLIQ